MSDCQIAFETSGRRGSVALLRQNITLRELVFSEDERTARAIGPAVQTLVHEVRKLECRIGFISCAVGPGSFTGLRLGVTAAKTLAFALQCPCVACDSLEVIARQVRGKITGDPSASTPPGSKIDIVVNAYRGQVFHRCESIAGDILTESCILDITQWNAKFESDLESEFAKFFVASDLAHPLIATESSKMVMVDKSTWYPRASTVGELGWARFLQNGAVGCFELAPNYLRESAAEEKRSKPA